MRSGLEWRSAPEVSTLAPADVSAAPRHVSVSRDNQDRNHIAAPRNVPDRGPVASSKMFPLPHQSGPVLPAAAAGNFLGRDASLLNDSTTRLRAIARRHAFNRRCSVRS